MAETLQQDLVWISLRVPAVAFKIVGKSWYVKCLAYF